MKFAESGEIVVQGPQIMRGYVDAALDVEAFTADAEVGAATALAPPSLVMAIRTELARATKEYAR